MTNDEMTWPLRGINDARCARMTCHAAEGGVIKAKRDHAPQGAVIEAAQRRSHARRQPASFRHRECQRP